ncbi:MAG: amidophosphoribosyltransferase, partial [bacterium]
HLRVSSPPIVYPCFYGIDMANQDEFIAFGRSVDEISRELGATSVAYLSLEGLMRATNVGEGEDRFCAACFTGEYPCEVPEHLRCSKFRYEQDSCGALRR